MKKSPFCAHMVDFCRPAVTRICVVYVEFMQILVLEKLE